MPSACQRRCYLLFSTIWGISTGNTELHIHLAAGIVGAGTAAGRKGTHAEPVGCGRAVGVDVGLVGAAGIVAAGWPGCRAGPIIIFGIGVPAAVAGMAAVILGAPVPGATVVRSAAGALLAVFFPPPQPAPQPPLWAAPQPLPHPPLRPLPPQPELAAPAQVMHCAAFADCPCGVELWESTTSPLNAK